MPFVYHEDVLDDPYAFDGSNSFVGGMVSFVRANLLTAVQSAELKNFDVDQTGQLNTRRGTIRLGDALANSPVQGLFYFDTPLYQQLLQVVNTGFYYWDGSTWSPLQAGYTAANAGLNIYFAQLENYAYWVDGQGLMHRWDGATITDSTTWGALQPEPGGFELLVAMTNRLVAAKGETLYFSDILDGTNYPVTQQIDVGGGEGDNIVAILPWIDFNLLVFKGRSIYLVEADPSVSVANFVVRKLHNSIGCVSQRSVVQAEQDVFFLAQDGVRTIARTIQDGQQTVSVPLSFPINDQIQQINKFFHKKCAAIFWQNRYILAAPFDIANSNNRCFVYHTVNQSWSGYWIGWTPTVFAVTAFNEVQRMIFGQQDGRVLEWRDYIPAINEADEDFQDDGVDIQCFFISRAYTFSEVMNFKRGNNFELEFYFSRALVDIYAKVDGQEIDLVDTDVPTFNGGGLLFPTFVPWYFPPTGIARRARDLLKFGEFREIQIALESFEKKVALRAVLLDALVNTIKFES